MRLDHLPVITALVFGLGISMFIGASLSGLIGFLVLATISGFVAGQMPRGSETVYWVSVGLVLLMIVLSYFGSDFSGFVFIAPIVFALCYFVARLTAHIVRWTSKTHT